MKTAYILAAMIFAATSTGASAATITSLTDGFETEVGVTNSVLNYGSFQNWDVSDGTVDLIKTGQYGIGCQSGSWCVDLDGSTSDAGILTTKDMFAAGSYTLSFGISGNQRNSSNDMLTVLAFGDYSETFTLAAGDPWMTITRTVNLASAAKLSFSNAGGDNRGIILDNVSVTGGGGLSAVPLPASVWLLGLGVGSFAATRRKRRSGDQTRASRA